MEFLHHVADHLIVEVYLTFNLLNIDRLQEITTFTVPLIPRLKVIAHYVPLFRHVYVFEAAILLSVGIVIKEEILFFLLSILESFQEIFRPIGFIFFSQGFKFDVYVHTEPSE